MVEEKEHEKKKELRKKKIQFYPLPRRYSGPNGLTLPDILVDRTHTGSVEFTSNCSLNERDDPNNRDDD